MDIKKYIELIDKASDPEIKLQIAKALYEADEVKKILRGLGYGWTGLSLLETAKEVDLVNKT